MVFFQESEQESEYLFLESGKHRVFYDEYHFRGIVDDGNLVPVDHLAHIVIEEIELFGDGHDISFESRTLCLRKRFRCNDASLYFSRSHERAIVAREVGAGLLEIAASAVAIIRSSLRQGIEYVVKHELDAFFAVHRFDGRFLFLARMELFEIRNGCLESFC